MKNIIISIQPEYCELIASGKKTVEVRKTAPQAPFRAFIYCTKQRFPNKKYLYINETSVRSEHGVCDDWLKYDTDTLNINERTPYQYETYFANGKIIGEFVCDYVEKEAVAFTEMGNLGRLYHCRLSLAELKKYAGKRTSLYYWHITALKIYDKPRELGEFYRCSDGKCQSYNCKSKYCGIVIECGNLEQLTRPPQSWQYVETDWAEEDKI